jgi:hypothetical protein
VWRCGVVWYLACLSDLRLVRCGLGTISSFRLASLQRNGSVGIPRAQLVVLVGHDVWCRVVVWSCGCVWAQDLDGPLFSLCCSRLCRSGSKVEGRHFPAGPREPPGVARIEP